MKGHFIPHSEETKKKISLTKTGVPNTKNSKKNNSLEQLTQFLTK